MSDRDALLAAVCAAPDDDTPRLVLADWLDENGDPDRAAYIRAAVARDREEPWSPAWRAAHRRFEPLHARAVDPAGPGKGWAAHLKGRVKAWTFARGMIGGITVFSKRFVAEGERFLAADPIRAVKFVTLASASGSVKPAALFACPHLARLTDLNLDNSELDFEAVGDLARSPHLRGLRVLSLGGRNPFGPYLAAELRGLLPALTALHFPGNTAFADAEALRLARGPGDGGLTVLNLNGTRVTAAGVAGVVGGPHAATLTALKLAPEELYDDEHGYPTGRDGDRVDGRATAEALAGATLPKLAELDLTGRRIGDAGLEALVAATGLPTLRRLILTDNAISRYGVEALAASRLGQQLWYLNLSFNSGVTPRPWVRSLFPNAHVESDQYGAA